MAEPVFWIGALVTGAGATAFMDVVAELRKAFFDTPTADFGMVGRWLLYMPRGRFRHDPIAKSPPLPGERVAGWTAHYVIGIAFAVLLVALTGIGWLAHPTLLPALAVGIGSVAAPFFVMHPGMGLGIAASKTPNPALARRRSVVAHAIYGVGLYAGGWLAAALLY